MTNSCGSVIETLGFRHIGVVHDEYAVSSDGTKAFAVLDLETEMGRLSCVMSCLPEAVGCRLSMSPLSYIRRVFARRTLCARSMIFKLLIIRYLHDIT
jgi:hypothetical protein